MTRKEDNNGKESQESKSQRTKPKDRTNSKNGVGMVRELGDDQSRELQQHPSSIRNDSGRKRVRRVRKSSGLTSQPSKRGSGKDKSGTKEDVEEGAGNRRQQDVEVTFTMDDLRHSLSDTILQQLLKHTYTPDTRVTLFKKAKLSSFAEDMFIETPKLCKKKSVKKSNIKPSERYRKEIDKYKAGKLKANAKVVLGHYFVLYKREYKEEDPIWATYSSASALTTIDKLAQHILDNDYEPIIAYTKKIMPLWLERLHSGQSFPTNRPTVQAMYGGTYHFWANRNLLYKQWQIKQ